MKKTGIFIVLSWLICISPLQSQNQKDKTRIQKILLVVAMNQEAQPIIKALNLEQNKTWHPELPMKIFSGKYAEKDIYLISNGIDPVHKVDNIGTQAAAIAAYLGIDHFQPDLVISIGTAGGVKEAGAHIDDIYVSDVINFFDRRIPLKGYEIYGQGSYPSWSSDAIAKKLNLKKGVVCTGNSFDLSPVDVANILKLNCSAVEMEAASIAWVSQIKQTPMLAIKGIADMIGKESEEQYEHFTSNTEKKLSEILPQFLTQMAKRV